MVKQHNNNIIKVICDDLVKSVRPFILCCIVKGVNLQKDRLRTFFQIQTKIHNSDIGGKREKSSIGTHDLSKLAPGGFIHYTAKSPDSLNFVPLNQSQEITASQLITDLKQEAEIIRKVDKRKVNSGIYKYVYLVENKQELACLEDAAGNVICLPPLINSESTKVVTETSDLFVEITSSSSLTDCLTTMEELLKEMLLAGFGHKLNEFDCCDQLRLEPVRIVDSDGYLKAIYPFTTDTQLDNIQHSPFDRNRNSQTFLT